MVRLNSPRRTELSLDDFKSYPVWTWDDDNEGYLPMSDTELTWGEYGIYFIRATFKTHKYIFDGYLIGCRTFYAIGLFVCGNEIILNKNMPDRVGEHLMEIFKLLKCQPFEFFPINYESSVRFKDGDALKGICSGGIAGFVKNDGDR